MIYLFTENIYLRLGITAALYPIMVECVPINEADHIAYAEIKEGDLLLIDPNMSFDAIIQGFSRYPYEMKVIFLNSDKLKEFNFRLLYPSSWVLNTRITSDEFRKTIINIITKKKRPLPSHNILNKTERYVLLESLKGLSVKEIAKSSNLKEKTIYHNVKSACNKMGVDKVWKIVPFKFAFNRYI